MMRKLVAGLALTGSLAFGAAGVAGASTPSTSTSHATACASAEKLAAWVTQGESLASGWLPGAQSREAAAKAAGHTKAAAVIARRIARVEKAQTKGNKVLAKIAAKCGTSAS
jgi:hypothetical protein